MWIRSPIMDRGPTCLSGHPLVPMDRGLMDRVLMEQGLMGQRRRLRRLMATVMATQPLTPTLTLTILIRTMEASGYLSVRGLGFMAVIADSGARFLISSGVTLPGVNQRAALPWAARFFWRIVRDRSLGLRYLHLCRDLWTGKAKCPDESETVGRTSARHAVRAGFNPSAFQADSFQQVSPLLWS